MPLLNRCRRRAHLPLHFALRRRAGRIHRAVWFALIAPWMLLSACSPAETANGTPAPSPTPSTPPPTPPPAPPPAPSPGTTPTAQLPWSTYGKLTLPVDEDGTRGADEIAAADLANYSSRYWYHPANGQLAQSGYRAAGGETVFWAPTNGNGTTGNSDFPRTEMREQLDLGSSDRNWRLTGTHIQRGTVTVTRLPTPLRSGQSTHVVFAQMHSVDNAPPVKLIFEAAADGSTSVFGNYNLRRRAGTSENSRIALPMALGRAFSYEIRVVDGDVTTTIDGRVIDSRNLRPIWTFEQFYFKAGNYLGNNSSDSTGFGEVVYSAIERIHR